MSSSKMVKEPACEVDSEVSEMEGIRVDLDALFKPTECEEKKSGSMLEMVRKYASLSDLLRYAGVVFVAVAMAMFLIDGSAHFTDLQRFLTMLGFTGALTAGGFTMSILLKEQRGSRAFICLLYTSDAADE